MVTALPHLDRDRYDVINGQVVNKEKMQQRRKNHQQAMTPLLLAGYELNPYPNRATRRDQARGAGWLPSGWHMYKHDKNEQTFRKGPEVAYSPKEYKAINKFAEDNNCVPMLSAYPKIRFRKKGTQEVIEKEIVHLLKHYDDSKKAEASQKRRKNGVNS